MNHLAHTVLRRLYSDYLMPSRLHHYAALLEQAHRAGYRQLPLRDYARLAASGATDDGRFLVHRHDIDTDIATARRMFDIERRHGVRASYYFRLSTLDPGLMRDIEAWGGEASYHYEEIATWAKRHHLRRPEQVASHLPAIREQFAANLARIEADLGYKLRSVASHGDFANRRLGIANHALLDDALRRRCGIECEAYDAALHGQLDIYISDQPAPRYFNPLSPQQALGRHRRICLLTHPLQWRTNWIDTSRHNLRRLYEELAW